MKIYLYTKINCAFISLGNEPEADDLMESVT